MSKKEEQKQVICSVIVSLNGKDFEEITRDNLCRGADKIISEALVKKLFGGFSKFKDVLKKAIQAQQSEPSVSDTTDDDDDWGDDEPSAPSEPIVTPASQDDDDWGDDEDDDWEDDEDDFDDEDDVDEDDDWEEVEDDWDDDEVAAPLSDIAIDRASTNVQGILSRASVEAAYDNLAGAATSFEEEADNVIRNSRAIADATEEVLQNEAWKSIKVFTATGNSVRVRATSVDTLRTILDASGVEWEGYQIRVDGEEVSNLDIIPEDRTIITVTTKIKGNMEEQKKVKVFDTNGQGKLVRIDVNATVEEILASVGISTAQGYTVMLNSEKVEDMTTVPGHKSIITVGEKIKGNAEAYVRVKLIPATGVATTLRPAQGTTLGQLLEENDIDVATGVTVMVNGAKADDMRLELQDKSIITVADKIKGNL